MMSAKTALVDASIAATIIAPDPLSYITGVASEETEEKDSSNTKGKPKDHKQQGGGNAGAEQKSKPEKKEQGTPPTVDERFYAPNDSKLQELRSDKPWTRGESGQQQQQQRQQRSGNTTGASINTLPRPAAKYFESLSLSPSAVTKIMMHCQSGVEKGVSKGGNPIEVMGLMLGRPDPYKPTNLIVTDAFPLPIEGFETRVVADDQDVVNHMISLGERLEGTRKEKFMGWYHSHPFDLVLGEDARSHCFLSQTDLSTQLQWQRAEDPHGNPFAAIVVDPLLSMHTGTPQLKAFRAYPPEYQSAIANECPDGSVVASEKQRLEKWGSCWNRYYELKVDYYMSEASRAILEDLTQDYLWMKSFQREKNTDVVGNTKGVSASESTKVATLRDISTDIRSEVGTGSEGRITTVPISRSAKIEPLVRKLRDAAILGLTQQTARSVHTKIFQGSKTNEAEETKEIDTTATH